MSVLYILGLLVAGGVGLLVGIKFRGAATKRDLAKTEWRIVQAFGERIDRDSVNKLATASDALEKSVKDANKPISR